MAKKRKLKIGDVRNRILKGLREKSKSKPKKTVVGYEETSTWKGKSSDIIKPKVKRKYFTNNKTGKKELAPPPGYVPEKAEWENTARTQSQIKSSLGDWSSDYGVKKKKMKGDYLAKKKQTTTEFNRTRQKMGSDFESIKKRMEEDFKKRKKRLGG